MSLRPVAATLAVAALGSALLAGCTSGDPAPPPDEAPVSLGWNRLADPVPVALPEGDPVGADEVSADERAELEAALERGEPVLVNFWASWCAPCREEMPLLVDLAERADVPVVGVSLDRFEDKAVEFLEEFDATYPSWRDPDMELMADYSPAVSPSRLPSSVLVVDGEVVASHVGEFTSADDLSAQRLRGLAG